MTTSVRKTKDAQQPRFLRHYTSIKNLFAILESGELRLGNPGRWKDKNDAASVDAFCRRTGAAKARILCFANGPELIHHWNTYAKNGCCITFDTPRLLAALDSLGIRHGNVLYRPLDELKAVDLRTLRLADLAFIKRRPYDCEQEYRLVWSGGAKDAAPGITHIGAFIESVTLSPYLPSARRDEIKGRLETGYQIKRVLFSRLLEDDRLIGKFRNLK